MRWPTIPKVTFEENVERLKVVLPVKINWIIFSFLTLSLIIWVGMLISIVTAIFTQGFGWLLITMLIIWLGFWYLLGRVLWRHWQYYSANREILFVNKSQLIIRRPLSILGITDAYDMNYISPFFHSDKHNCPAFAYGHKYIYFGHHLEKEGAEQLVGYLNSRYFPHMDDDE